jgi:hypothetical protein
MMKNPNFLCSLIFLAVASISGTVLAAPGGGQSGVSNMGRMGGMGSTAGVGQPHGGGGQPHGGGQPQGGGHGYGNYGHGYYGHGYYGHGHGYYGPGYGFGIYLGAPYYPYPYYPYPYYPYYPYPYYAYPYYPPVVVETAPAEPPVYIEQGTPQLSAPQEPSQEANSYWYHCAKPDGYYPYVKECPSGWEKVKPMPTPQQ